MNNKKTKLKLILSIITALVACFTLVFFFRIINNKNEHTGAVLSNLEDKIQKKRDSSSLIKKSEEIKTTRDIVTSYFVNTNEIDSFVDYLENIGSLTSTAVTVESVEVSKIDANVLTIKISSEGEFSNVVKALKILENSPYKVQIQQVYLNKQLLQTTKEELKKIPIKPQTSNWKADIIFTILTTSK